MNGELVARDNLHSMHILYRQRNEDDPFSSWCSILRHLNPNRTIEESFDSKQIEVIRFVVVVDKN